MLNAINPSAAEKLAFATATGVESEASLVYSGTLRTVAQAARVASAQNIAPWELLTALSEGSSSTSAKMLFKVLAVLAHYLTPWGALTIIMLGIYQAAQTAKATPGFFTKLIAKATGIAAPFEVLKTFFKNDGAADAPDTAMESLVQLITIEAPLAGLLFKIFEPAALKDGRTTSNILKGGGYDADIAYDGEADVMYDEDKNPIDTDHMQVGDIAYDEHGDAFMLQSDGVLQQVSDAAFDE